MYSVHFFSGWLTTSNISEETLRGSQYLENLQAIMIMMMMIVMVVMNDHDIYVYTSICVAANLDN